mmetsp:Transcript_9987/g.22136  ORF Transcript_9987/g.22136 Transcript_9987/m.22136 type:complete len:212 (+) Transcript_9987:384-1019(+)
MSSEASQLFGLFHLLANSSNQRVGVVSWQPFKVLSFHLGHNAILVRWNVDVKSLVLRPERWRNEYGESAMSINHGCKRVPAIYSCFCHDRFPSTCHSSSNLNHCRVRPTPNLLIKRCFQLNMSHPVFDTDRTTDAFCVSYKGGILLIVRVNLRLPSVHHCTVHIDLVIHPDISNLNSPWSGWRSNQVHCKLITLQELLQQRILRLSSIRSQ